MKTSRHNTDSAVTNPLTTQHVWTKRLCARQEQSECWRQTDILQAVFRLCSGRAIYLWLYRSLPRYNEAGHVLHQLLRLQPPPHIRRRSQSSAGSSYGYPGAPHLHKPRPIVIASAIEKSDFRTHLDGMSSTLRGKIGGFMKGGKKETNSNILEKPRRRPGTSSAESDFEFNSRSTELTTPSTGAVPSLTNSTTPSEGPGTLSSHQSYSLPSRTRQNQDAVIHKIRKFEGGGKLPELGWQSLSNVGSLKS